MTIFRACFVCIHNFVKKLKCKRIRGIITLYASGCISTCMYLSNIAALESIILSFNKCGLIVCCLIMLYCQQRSSTYRNTLCLSVYYASLLDGCCSFHKATGDCFFFPQYFSECTDCWIVQLTKEHSYLRFSNVFVDTCRARVQKRAVRYRITHLLQ